MPAFHSVLAGLFKPGLIVIDAIIETGKRTGLTLAAALIALLSTSFALGQEDPANQAVTEIVRLQHRSPDAIRAAITPLLDSRGAISQMDNNLIISTSRANLTELQALIRELDIAVRQLRVSIDFRYTPDNATNQESRADNVVTVTGTAEPEDNSRQSIVVSEGEYAYFSTLNSNPILSVTATDNGLLLIEDRQQSGQSIGLSAELRDNDALIRIATAQSQADATAADLQSRIVNTSVVLGFNEWFVLNEEPIDDSDTSNVIATTTRSADVIAVKVELMR